MHPEFPGDLRLCNALCQTGQGLSADAHEHGGATCPISNSVRRSSSSKQNRFMAAASINYRNGFDSSLLPDYLADQWAAEFGLPNRRVWR
jgi:hypothetical protein